MKPNPLRARLAAGEALVGTMLQEVSSPFIVHLCANAGFDFVYVDMEHGRFSTETAINLIQTLRLTDVAPLVRPPDNQYHLVARLLDAGAYGVMVPRINTAEQARRAISAVRYPPVGERGLAVARGHNDYQRADSLAFAQHANRENLVIVQIESSEAVEAIDEILAVPGIDVALIGPGDLSQSLGISMKMDDPKMVAAMNKVVSACQKAGVYVGLHVGNLPAISYWAKHGIQLLSGSSDLDILLDGCMQFSKAFKTAVDA